MGRTRYLYLAQESSAVARRYHIYKMGCSVDPKQRKFALGGSCSTATFHIVCTMPLPDGIKDIHVLQHTKLAPYRLRDSPAMRQRYLRLFGDSHADGLGRRRELLMFGASFSHEKVITLVRGVYSELVSRDQSGYLSFRCQNPQCRESNADFQYCDVCKGVLRTVQNRRHYRRQREPLGPRRLSLRVARGGRWRGPRPGQFWVRRSAGGEPRLCCVQRNAGAGRASEVSWWECIDCRLYSQCGADEAHVVDWDDGGWIMPVRVTRRQQKAYIVRSDYGRLSQVWRLHAQERFSTNRRRISTPGFRLE